MRHSFRERHRGEHGRRRGGDRFTRTLPQEINGHHCHAYKCAVPTTPDKFMCDRHWIVLSRALQRRLVAMYRKGQEIDKRPSQAYMIVAHECIRWVARREFPKEYPRLLTLHTKIEACYDQAEISRARSAT